MNDETTGCADDDSALGYALKHIRHGASADVAGGTFTITLLNNITTEPIAFNATEAEVQAAVDEAIAKHLLQLQVPDGTPSHHEFDLHCACGSKETITVSHITDLYRVLNEKGYVLIPTQHGRIVQVVCPDCRVIGLWIE